MKHKRLVPEETGLVYQAFDISVACFTDYCKCCSCEGEGRQRSDIQSEQLNVLP